MFIILLNFSSEARSTIIGDYFDTASFPRRSLTSATVNVCSSQAQNKNRLFETSGLHFSIITSIFASTFSIIIL